MPSRTDKPRSPPAAGSLEKPLFGIDQVTATASEDRGNAGMGGGRPLHVRLDIPATSELELPADHVKTAV